MSTCIHGHEMTPDNTYQRPRGGQECRACKRQQVITYDRRKRLERERQEDAMSYRSRTWVDQALCREVDPDLFFPEKGGNIAEPVSICKTCPVQTECLAEAIAEGEEYGIWGGLSALQRDKLRRRNDGGLPRDKACERCGVARVPTSRHYCGECKRIRKRETRHRNEAA